MSAITEKIAYLKGLAEGMEIDQTTKEGKLLFAMLGVLDEVGTALEDLEDYTSELTEQVDAIDEDLDALECEVYEWDDDDDDDEDFYCDGDCDVCAQPCDDMGSTDSEFYDVTCPSCDTTFCVDEDILLEGEIECPNCGERLEFEIDEEEDTEDGDEDGDAPQADTPDAPEN